MFCCSVHFALHTIHFPVWLSCPSECSRQPWLPGEEVGQQEVHKVVAGGREGEGTGAGAGAGARAGVKLLGYMNMNIYKQQ